MHPARIGRYELEAPLGAGGCGAVYRARDPALARPVAVKLLTAAGAPEAHARFAREAQALARLDHPGVARVLDAGVDGGRPYLVVELVEGEPLDARLRRAGPLAPAEAARVVAAVARAVAAAHAAGVLHRDLKPSNVVLGADGAPRLIDFGLARLLDPQAPTLSVTGELLGTPELMAPEQAEASPRGVGVWTDVWGLGATLFTLLAGGPPFRGASTIATLRAVLEDPPGPLPPGTPPELAAVVRRCLEKPPARRPESADAVAEALEGWLAGPTRAGARPERVASRRAAVAVAALVVAAAGVGGVAAALTHGPGAATTAAAPSPEGPTDDLARPTGAPAAGVAPGAGAGDAATGAPAAGAAPGAGAADAATGAPAAGVAPGAGAGDAATPDPAPTGAPGVASPDDRASRAEAGGEGPAPPRGRPLVPIRVPPGGVRLQPPRPSPPTATAAAARALRGVETARDEAAGLAALAAEGGEAPDLERAAGLVREAPAGGPNDPAAADAAAVWCLAARIAHERGWREASLAAAARALALARTPDALGALVRALPGSGGDAGGAVEALRGVDPGHPALGYVDGNAAFLRREPAAALDACARALARDPGDLDALNLRTYVLLRSGRHDEALAHARTAARVRPDAAPPAQVLGRVALELGARARDRALLREAAAASQAAIDLARAPYWRCQARATLAQVHLVLEEPDRAAAACEAALEDDPGFFDAAYFGALAYDALGARARAGAFAARALAIPHLTPDDERRGQLQGIVERAGAR